MDEHMFDTLVFEAPPPSMDEFSWPPEQEEILDPVPGSPREERLPSFDEVKPDAVLAVLLSTIDVNQLSGFDRVTLLRAHQRLASHFNALVYQDLAALSDHYLAEAEGDYETADEAAALEVRAALRWTRQAAKRDIDFAIQLNHRLPQVGEALDAGLIDVRRARVIAHGTSHLDDETARMVVDRVIGDAPRFTTGQLAARVRKLCIGVDPEEAKQRYETALEGRRVVSQPTVEGTEHLLIEHGSPHLVAEAKAHVNKMPNRFVPLTMREHSTNSVPTSPWGCYPDGSATHPTAVG